jgi:hypothetical protein
MIDINNLINTAITNAVNAAVEARLEAINAVLQVHANSIDTLAKQPKPKPEVNVEVDMDALRALVIPMVESVVAQAVADHCEEYDHDSYDNVVNAVDDMGDLPDFDDFVKNDDLSDAVKDAVNNLTFEVSVS